MLFLPLLMLLRNAKQRNPALCAGLGPVVNNVQSSVSVVIAIMVMIMVVAPLEIFLTFFGAPVAEFAVAVVSFVLPLYVVAILRGREHVVVVVVGILYAIVMAI